MITCLAMVEQLGLFIACQERGLCLCYLNGSPLHNEPVAANHGDFLAIYKSDNTRSDATGQAMLSTASTRRLGGSTGTVSECPSGHSAVLLPFCHDGSTSDSTGHTLVEDYKFLHWRVVWLRFILQIMNYNGRPLPGCASPWIAIGPSWDVTLSLPSSFTPST